jgi:hypothetical protein
MKSEIFQAAEKLDATADVGTEQDLSELARRAEFFRGSSKPAQVQHASTWLRSKPANINGRAKSHAVNES